MIFNVPNTPAPLQSCCHCCRFPDNHVFLLNLSFQLHLHLSQVFYLFFYCLEEKRKVVSQRGGENVTPVALKK